MNTELVHALIEKGAIKERTEIEAYYNGRDLSGARLARVRGTFIVKKAKRLVEGKIAFDGFSIIDGQLQNFLADDILMIDGMEPERFANIYGFDENGNTLRQGKRRGRKPKALLAKIAAEKTAQESQETEEQSQQKVA